MSPGGPSGRPSGRMSVGQDPPPPRPPATLRSGRQRTALLDALASSLDAGVPAAEALETYGHGGGEEAGERVRTGATLAVALRQAGLLDSLGEALVRAAEEAGDVPTALREIGQDLEATRQRLLSVAWASAYPVFLLVFANFVMPLPTLVLEGVRPYLAASLPPFFCVAIPLTCLAWALAIGRLSWSQALRPTRRIPGLARVHGHFAAARLCRVLGRLLGAGLSIDVALAHTARTLPYSDQRRAVESMRTAIRGGSGLAASLGPTGLLDAESMAVVATAERAGRLEQALGDRARVHAAAAAHGAKAAGAVLSTLLTLLVLGRVALEILLAYRRVLPGLGGGDLPPEVQELFR